ncbi:response regulator [Pedobacter sp. P351]|uniref:response regulator n=1 Tax=Pedobacter superstes TaxID=3133441 RepID=UPI0030A8D63E
MPGIKFKQFVLYGFLTTIVCVLILGVSFYISINSLQQNENKIAHMEEVLFLSNQIQQKLLNAESSSRGYVLTERQDFLDAYTHSVKLINPGLNRLRQLVLDNPEQLKNIDSLDLYTSLKLSGMSDIIRSHNIEGIKVSSGMLKISKSKFYMDKVLQHLHKINETEGKLSVNKKTNNDKIINRAIGIVAGGSAIILCLILFLSTLIRRIFSSQKKIEAEMFETNTKLEFVSRENSRQNWLLQGAVMMDSAMRGAQTINERCECIIREMSKYVQADLGVMYTVDSHLQELHLRGVYGFSKTKGKHKIKLDEGLIGVAVNEKSGLIFNNIPDNYTKVSSGLGETLPQALFIQPIFFQDTLKGVIELAFLNGVPEHTAPFLDKVVHSIGVSINAAEARVQMQELVEKTQQQAEELETQHEELLATNEELIRKTQLLQASEEELIVQQEELKQTNAEIEEKAQLLEEKNKAIELAREAISLKAEELELSSRYKSDFLANMSHELRTPLNSILILAKILKENKPLNLSEEQIKYAGVIHNAGSDLLTLINDILDLSKIESGKVDLSIEEVGIKEVGVDLELLFKEVANKKNIDFTFNIAPEVPATIKSDRLRLEQILKNLLSNAFKFTPETGRVSLEIRIENTGHNYYSDNLSGDDITVMAFCVKDSGIGIPDNKQKAIFEAFQQADGSTSRKYGGTGLGLSISRQLSHLLGGEIQVESIVNQGSIFTLYLPLVNHVQTDFSASGKISPLTDMSVSFPEQETQDAEILKLANPDKEYTLLIIEDDIYFADILKNYAEDRGFKTLIAYQGDTGFEMAKKHMPDAIVLDIMLPVIDGWAVLKELKDDDHTRAIPVHLMSAEDEKNSRAKEEGALGFLRKPVEKNKLQSAFDLLIKETGNVKLTRVLLVEDQKIQSDNLTLQLKSKNIKVEQSFSGEQTIAILSKDSLFDCIILDLKLPDISGLDLLEKIKADPRLSNIPVVINTAMEMDKENLTRVLKHTDVMVLKNNKSNDRVLDEVNLFMNKIQCYDPAPAKSWAYQNRIKASNTTTLEKTLKNRSVLLVDDDMRNIFALTSALHGYDLNIQIANNGIEALKKLDEFPDTDIVLMDIMMPEMDGYEAMLAIRKQSRFVKLPIIALTAKAMKSDREKCIEAGANDYVSKPVDMDKLLSIMRVWLS